MCNNNRGLTQFKHEIKTENTDKCIEVNNEGKKEELPTAKRAS